MRATSERPSVESEPLESRHLLANSVMPWKSLAAVPVAKGLTSDLNLSSFRPYAIDTATLGTRLGQASAENVAGYGIGGGAAAVLISVPRPDGSLQRFRVVESDILTGKTAEKFSSIRTYAGVGVDDKAATVRLDLTPLGFHAQVLTPTGRGAYYVEPYYNLNQSVYASYYRTDSKPGKTPPCLCGGAGCPMCQGATAASSAKNNLKSSPRSSGSAAATATAQRTTGTQLRTYRTAVATTGEFSSYYGGTAAASLAAVTTIMNRVSGVYESELSIRLTLVPNESSLIYTNAATDPYTNADANALLDENQANLDSIIKTANYDIGHVFSTGGGGLAGLGVVGVAGSKAQGETGSSAPVGDNFAIDYVAHEMGHQFGGNHTFNTTTGSGGGGNRNASTAYEIGSGTTIMAYAGITTAAGDSAPHSDPYFAWKSVDEILTYVDTSPISSVGTRTDTGNSIPTVAPMGTNYSIPINTPFALTATGSDANGDTIYYSWEEADLGAAQSLTAAQNTTSPIFRVYNPTISPTRVFPRLESILAGSLSTASPGSTTATPGYVERLPTLARTTKFVVTARDQRAGGGGTNVLSGSVVSVVSVAAANGFAITNLNSAATLTGGSAQAITWNVANTTASPVSTANVQIAMSTDNGATFPYVLAASTANDGTETVTLPTGLTSSDVRFRVAAVGNIFFDINNAKLSITPGATGPSTVPGVPDLLAASDTGTSNTDDLTNRNNAAAASALQFNVAGTVSGATVGIYADDVLVGSAVAGGTTTTVTTNGTAALADGVRQFTARQTAGGQTLSAASGALPVTVDTVAPSVVTKTLEFQTVKPRVVIVYDSTLVAGGGTASVLRNNPSPALMSFAQSFSDTGNVANFTFASSPNGILPNGNYTATLPADTFRDAAGNGTAATTLNFFYVAGDANRDRTANFNDFLIVQANFGATGPVTFGQGDFNYDGVIDFNDFLVLQSNFNVTV